MQYRYDFGGNLLSAEGEEGGQTYTCLKEMTYDKFGQRVFVADGNRDTAHYTYNPLNLRLTDWANPSDLDPRDEFPRCLLTL